MWRRETDYSPPVEERERERERERQGDKDRSFTELRERQEQGRQELCRGERDSGQNLALK
jgi:hypothetical protein